MFQGICPGQSIVTATCLYYALFSYCHFFLVMLYLYFIVLFSLMLYLYIYTCVYIYGFVSRLKIGYTQRKCWLTDGFWAPYIQTKPYILTIIRLSSEVRLGNQQRLVLLAQKNPGGQAERVHCGMEGTRPLFWGADGPDRTTCFCGKGLTFYQIDGIWPISLI